MRFLKVLSGADRIGITNGERRYRLAGEPLTPVHDSPPIAPFTANSESGVHQVGIAAHGRSGASSVMSTTWTTPRGWRAKVSKRDRQALRSHQLASVNPMHEVSARWRPPH